MTEIVYAATSSLDGYIATPEGSVDWLTPFYEVLQDPEVAALHASFDALLMGSRTYEFALTVPRWPSPDKPSWVFTRRLLRLAHPSVTLTADDPVKVVEALRKRGVRRAWLMGGGKLASSFRQSGLIDRYAISVAPILLGEGIPLLAPAPRQDALTLVASKAYANGVVQLSYVRAKNGA